MDTSTQFDFTYISLGAGVQSTALLIASVLGLHNIPRADCAIFADTQGEPAWVYENLERLNEFALAYDFPIHVVSRGSLLEDIRQSAENGKQYVNVPAFTVDENGQMGTLRRQCTREYKIEVIEKKVRDLLGYKPRKHIRESVACMLGISLNEFQRMKPSRTRWITNIFPLVDARLDRDDCIGIIADAGLPIPKKSACVFCPYHSDAYWIKLKQYPTEWQKAVEIDRTIRDMSRRGMRQPVFLHRTCKPLDEVRFRHEEQAGLFDAVCEEGYCGV